MVRRTHERYVDPRIQTRVAVARHHGIGDVVAHFGTGTHAATGPRQVLRAELTGSER